MGTVPTTDNKLADFLRGLIQALMTDGETAADAYITALDPAILALPPVAFVVDEIISELGNALSDVMGNGITGIVIDIQANGEKSAVVQASTALQYAEASGDATAIATAKQDALSAWASVIHWDGSSTSSS